MILNNFSDISNLTAVDLGCGLSRILEYLYEQGIDSLYGVDFIESVIEVNKHKY